MASVEFYHEHPLSFIDSITDEEARCCVCELRVSGTTYSCNKKGCDFIIHHLCLYLPLQISHPFHGTHPLQLDYQESPYLTNNFCLACRRDSPFRYQCYECHVDLCVPCASLAPAIVLKDHDHPLNYLMYRGRMALRCMICVSSNASRSAEYGTQSGNPLEFSSPDYVVPELPLTLLHDCHVHPLRFIDSLDQDEDDDDDNADKCYVCDACEMERLPKFPVYYCSECDFIAHVSCVISQVAPSVEGEWSFFFDSMMKKWNTMTMVREIIDMVSRKEVKEHAEKGRGLIEEEEDQSKIEKLRGEVEELRAQLEKKEDELRLLESKARASTRSRILRSKTK